MHSRRHSINLRPHSADVHCNMNVPAGHGHPITGLCVLPNPEFLASCSSVGSLRAWHLASNETIARLSIQQELTSMAIR